jgi:hypothetical protein
MNPFILQVSISAQRNLAEHQLENKMQLSIKKLHKPLFAFLGVLFTVSSSALAQTYPTFSTPGEQSQIDLDAGISLAEVPNGLYGNALMSVYSYEGALNYSISANGTTSVYNIRESGQNLTSSVNSDTTVPYVDCRSGIPGNCSASIAVFDNKIYVAYADSQTLGIDVLEATPIANNVGYSWSLVYQSNAVSLTTTPAMASFTNPTTSAQQLVIIFGATKPFNNAFYSVNFNGTTWTAPNDANLGGSNLQISSGAQPALVEFNGQLWLCSQQNNSHHNMYVYTSPDGNVWNFETDSTGLALGGGASMVVFNNTLVLANQQNNSTHDLFIFVSTNGANWTAQQYTSIQMGSTPGLALYNGDLALQFQSNSGSPKPLFTSIASH